MAIHGQAFPGSSCFRSFRRFTQLLCEFLGQQSLLGQGREEREPLMVGGIARVAAFILCTEQLHLTTTQKWIKWLAILFQEVSAKE